MDRTINVTVSGEFVRKDSKNAGVQGEANATVLHIAMSGEWEQYSKRIIWRNALGEAPVAVLLYNSVEDLAAQKDPLVFDTPIPAEPLALEGWCSFTIEGFRESDPTAVSITVTDHLLVKPNDAYNTPQEPTPTQAQQLQAQIDEIVPQMIGQVKTLVGDALERFEQTGSWSGWDDDTPKPAQICSYHTTFQAEDWVEEGAEMKLAILPEVHGLNTERSILCSTLRMLVHRSAVDFTEDTLDSGKARFIAALEAAIAANSAAAGTYPVDETAGYPLLTWAQVQYYLLEQTLASAEEAAAQAATLGFDWEDTDTTGAETTTTLNELLSAAYTVALGGSSATLDSVWTVDALRGLRLRWGVSGVYGVRRKWDCVGEMSRNTWAVMESEVSFSTDGGALVVSCPSSYDGELLVLSEGA